MYNGLHQVPPAGGMRVSPHAKDRPAVQIIPFDHVARFELEGIPGRLREDVINISVEGTFIALALGYGLASDMLWMKTIISLKNFPTRTSDGEMFIFIFRASHKGVKCSMF